MDEKTKEFENLLVQSELKRIADIMEEILRIIKKDMGIK
jgi:Skp family chaperone for outer membrane proteins